MILDKRLVTLGISTHYGRISTRPVPGHNLQNQHRYHLHRCHCRRHLPHQYQEGRVTDCADSRYFTIKLNSRHMPPIKQWANLSPRKTELFSSHYKR